MSDEEGIERYSHYIVTELIFGEPGFPDSAELVSYVLRNKTEGAISPIKLQAKLTKTEKLKLAVLLNDIATRIENEIRESLQTEE